MRVAPITHTPPKDATDAVELLVDTKRRLGLDDAPSWISTRETNVFNWPGPDLRPVSRQAGTVAYGLLAGKTFCRLRDTIIANIRARQARSFERDE